MCTPPPQELRQSERKETHCDKSSEQGGYSTGLSEKATSVFDDKSECSLKSPSKQCRISNNANTGSDEFDDLTLIELKSLLDNFKK